MHKVEVTRVTSVLALWVLSEKKNKIPDFIFQERPFKKGRMQGWPRGGAPVHVLKSDLSSFSIHKAYLGISVQTLTTPPDLCSQV